jgi:hypothetical protein
MTEHAQRQGQRERRPLLPTTATGRWAVALALGFLVLQPLWMVLPGGGAASLLSGLAGGVVAIVAVRRQGERALAVLAAMIPLALVVLLIAGELLLPH